MDLPTAAVQIAQQQTITTLVPFVVGVLVLCFFWGMFMSAINPSPKSQKARKLATDLYVIGMIRKFAKEDDIDLETEMKNLKRIEKWEKASRRDLDYNIEANLAEKIDAKVEKQIEEIEKQ